MTRQEGWVADPGVAWVILLAATLREAPDLSGRYDDLRRRHDWLPPDPGPVVADSERAALARLCSETTAQQPVRLALVGQRLLIGAHHRFVDGLGLLAMLSTISGSRVSSSARGLGDRAGDRRLGSLSRRLTEVAVRPPARVRESTAATTPDDVFARLTLPMALSSADLAWAGSRAVMAWNHRGGRPARRISVAVGASTRGGAQPVVGDHSALLRLTGVERMSRDDVRAALRGAGPETVPGATAGGGSELVARATRQTLRLLAPRLGSTLLVSHLGAVTTPGAADLDFYPVTGGGSGLSLGAVTSGDETRLTLRARGRQHDTEGLEEILEALGAVLTDGGAERPGQA